MIKPSELPDPARPLTGRELDRAAEIEISLDHHIRTCGERDDWPLELTLTHPGTRIVRELAKRYKEHWLFESTRTAGNDWHVTIRPAIEPLPGVAS